MKLYVEKIVCATLSEFYSYPFLNVYIRIVWLLRRNFAVWGGGVADPNETIGKISMLNELFPLSWAPRADFTVQGLVPNLSHNSRCKWYFGLSPSIPGALSLHLGQSVIRFYCRVSCMKELAPIA